MFIQQGVNMKKIAALLIALAVSSYPDSEAEKIATVGDVIEYIKNNQ